MHSSPEAPFDQPFFHVGILVPDINEAIDRLSATLGVQFLPPRTFTDDYIEDPEPRLSTTTVTFSVQGPPYIELIQVEKGVYGADRMGLHHLAMWTSDHADCRRHLEAHGVRMAARMGEPGTDAPFYYTDPDDLYGISVEIFDTGGPRKALYSWFADAAALAGSPDDQSLTDENNNRS